MVAMGNSPIVYSDPNGELAWFVVPLVGAVVGGGGATNLTRTGARVWEQTLINQHGLPHNGGTLINKVNSISPKY